MLQVMVRLGDLRIGDVFSARFTDSKPETVTALPQGPDEHGCWSWRTKERAEPWVSSGLDQEVTLHATSSGALGERVAEALDAFPEDVRVVALRAFCPACGKRKRACREHM
jgi:hypothetical protein